MKEKIKNILKSLFEIIHKYYIIELFFVCSFFYLVYESYINMYIILKSLMILCILASYKFVLIHMSADRQLEDYVANKLNLKIKIILFLEKYIIRGNKIIIKIIYYSLYYFPTNWFYLIVLWIGRKWWDARLWINSNKDIIGQKYLKKNWQYMRSPLNYKYTKFFKKWVYNIIFNLLYFPVYFKVRLIAMEWNKFFKSRLIGTIYGMLLIINNLHFGNWLRTTESITFYWKIILIIILIYLFSCYIHFWFFSIVMNNINKIQEKLEKDKNSVSLENAGMKVILFNLSLIIDYPTISMYYKVSDYLIFMSFADRFGSTIDAFYNSYLLKNLNESNKKIPINLIRLGRVSANKYECTNKYKNPFFLIQLEERFQLEEKIKKNYNEVSSIDFIWILEKNYRISTHMYVLSFDEKCHFINAAINYELFKTFYGKEIVDYYFKEEIEEFESLWFIGILMNNLFEFHFDVKNVILSILNKEKNDIPLVFKCNKELKRMIKICNFYLYINHNNLYFLSYSNFFSGKLVDELYKIYEATHISALFWPPKPDVTFTQYKNKFNHLFDDDDDDEDYEKKKDTPWSRLQLEVYINYHKNINAKEVCFQTRRKELNLNDKSVSDALTIVENLQKEHKKKYFKKELLKTKSFDFLLTEKFLEEWKFFEKKNKDMFI